MEVAPWPAPQQHRAHPGLPCRQDVVVEPIADVGHALRRHAGDVGHGREERRVGLGDRARRRSGSPRRAERHRLQRRRACGGWLPAMTTRHPAAAERRGTAARPGRGRRVEVFAEPPGSSPAHRHLGLDVDSRSDDLEGLACGRSVAAIAPIRPSMDSRVTPRRSAHRDQMRVSSISVSPTSNATAAGSGPRPGR